MHAYTHRSFLIPFGLSFSPFIHLLTYGKFTPDSFCSHRDLAPTLHCSFLHRYFGLTVTDCSSLDAKPNEDKQEFSRQFSFVLDQTLIERGFGLVEL